MANGRVHCQPSSSSFSVIMFLTIVSSSVGFILLQLRLFAMNSDKTFSTLLSLYIYIYVDVQKYFAFCEINRVNSQPQCNCLEENNIHNVSNIFSYSIILF